MNEWDSFGRINNISRSPVENIEEEIEGEEFKNELLFRSKSFENSSLSLERKLQNRSSSFELEDRNILKVGPLIASSLQSAQQTLKFKRTSDILLHKLGNRPSREQLIKKNIIRQETGGIEVAPGLQGAQQMLKFHQTMDQIDNKLEHRPEREHLITNHILQEVPIEEELSDDFNSESFRFQTTFASFDFKIESRSPPKTDHIQESTGFKARAAIMDHKLENRPQPHDLIDQNIMKMETSKIAPSIQAAQQSLSRHKVNDTLNVKLKLRPSAYVLEQHNILKQDIPTTTDDLQRDSVSFSLNTKILKRPSLDELYQSHIIQ